MESHRPLTQESTTTQDEIRSARRGGDSTWEILQTCIDRGQEYPDAVWSVTKALRLDKEQVAEMESSYTDYC